MPEQPELNEQWSKLVADTSSDETLQQRLREQPVSVLKEYGLPVQGDLEARELGDSELAGVSGGMKWTPGTSNPDVIDARGGQVKIMGFTFTLDVNGKISSITT